MKGIWSLFCVLKEYKAVRVELGSRGQCCANPFQKCTHLLEVWYIMIRLKVQLLNNG